MTKNCDKCGVLLSVPLPKYCPQCGTIISDNNTSNTDESKDSEFKYSKTEMFFNDPLCTDKVNLLSREKINTKQIEEMRCTCNGCGNVWFYGKKDLLNEDTEKLKQRMKGMVSSSCPCCLPLFFLGNKDIIDYNKCPKCGSRAIKKERIIHEVE